MSARIHPKFFCCHSCQSDFPNTDGRYRRYCSRRCAWNAQKGKPSNWTGQVASIETRRKQSLAKKALIAGGWMPPRAWKQGNPAWNKGLGVGRRLKTRIRFLKVYEDWREGVFRLCDRKCVGCGAIKKLHAHHKHQFSDIIVEEGITTLKQAEGSVRLWDITNGVVLCAACHKKLHAEYTEIRHAMAELVAEGRVQKRVEYVAGRPVTSFRYLQ